MQWPATAGKRVTSGGWLEKIPCPAKASGTRPGSEAVRENHRDKKLRLGLGSAVSFEWFTGNSNSEPPRLDSACWKLEARSWTSTAEALRQKGRRGSPRCPTPSGTRTVLLPIEHPKPLVRLLRFIRWDVFAHSPDFAIFQALATCLINAVTGEVKHYFKCPESDYTSTWA